MKSMFIVAMVFLALIGLAVLPAQAEVVVVDHQVVEQYLHDGDTLWDVWKSEYHEHQTWSKFLDWYYERGYTEHKFRTMAIGFHPVPPRPVGAVVVDLISPESTMAAEHEAPAPMQATTQLAPELESQFSEVALEVKQLNQRVSEVVTLLIEAQEANHTIEQSLQEVSDQSIAASSSVLAMVQDKTQDLNELKSEVVALRTTQTQTGGRYDFPWLPIVGAIVTSALLSALFAGVCIYLFLRKKFATQEELNGERKKRKNAEADKFQADREINRLNQQLTQAVAERNQVALRVDLINGYVTPLGDTYVHVPFVPGTKNPRKCLIEGIPHPVDEKNVNGKFANPSAEVIEAYGLKQVVRKELPIRPVQRSEDFELDEEPRSNVAPLRQQA